jgi:hypothetical protein
MNTGSRVLCLVSCLVILLGYPDCKASAGSLAEMITEEAIRGHVYFLASDALEGRYVGSAGYEVAARYGESQFIAAGLAPVIPGPEGYAYLQEVPVLRRRVTGDLRLTVTTSEAEASFLEGEGFIWLQGEVFPWEGRVFEAVYAGYAISEPDHDWDDLEGLDVRGKIALILLGAPMSEDGSVLPEDVHTRYAPPSAVFKKMMNLMLAGAAGILIVPDPMILEGWHTLPSKADNPQFEYNNKEAGSIHIPLLFPVKPEVADAIFAGQEHVPPGMGHLGAETTKGFNLEGISLTLTGSFSEEEIPTWNVIGLVEGTDPLRKDEYVVVTAHLDSTAPREEGEINNGADDNASGCAGLIEIARVVAASPPGRSVLFVLCSGEEAACIGSRHFVSDPPVALDRIVANVNMDMIGRTDPASEADRSHYAIDSEKITPEFTRLIKDVNSRTVGWPLKYESPVGTSDNLMFHIVGIPAVSFYSGHHEDVNLPTDDPEKLDYDKAHKIAQLVYEVTMELGNGETLW